jgi:2-dehydro-3-deoxygluconokinase
VAELKAGDLDWSEIFHGGVRWFHSGGIFAALSATMSELIIEGMGAAKAVGAVVSFDLNYREKLRNVWDGHRQAVPIFRRIVENVDVLVGNEEDFQKALGTPSPEIGRASGLDSSAFVGMIEKVRASFSQIKVVATTLREVVSSTRYRWGAVASIDGETYTAPTSDLDVLDRVGDGFAAGLFFGFLAGEEPQQAVDLGWPHGALLTTFPGDATMATLQQVRDLAGGGSARVRR